MDEIKNAAREKFNAAIDGLTTALKADFDKIYDDVYPTLPPFPTGGTEEELKELKEIAIDITSLAVLSGSLTGAANASEKQLMDYTLSALLTL